MIVNRSKYFVIPEIVQGRDETGGRVYTTPEGNIYPSMTRVLGSMSTGFLEEWRAKVGEEQANLVSRVAAARGTQIHLLAEKYVMMDKVGYEQALAKTMPDLKVSWKTLAELIRKNITELYASEQRLWSDELRLAGTVDLICMYGGKRVVLDYKTSSKYKDISNIQSYFMQCAGYAKMWEELTGDKIEDIVILIVTEETSSTHEYIGKVADYLPALYEVRAEYDKCA